MKKSLLLILLVVTLIPMSDSYARDDYFVRMSTSNGDILLHLRPDLAPAHVDNFLFLIENGFYNNTAFHRVIPGFMIQGGCPNSKDDNRRNDGQGGPLLTDVLSLEDAMLIKDLNEKLEADGYVSLTAQVSLKAEFNDEPHVRGSLSMARSQHPDSAGSQFFICVARAANLDKQYTNFGNVIYGMDVVDSIVNAPRDRYDNPHQKIVIENSMVLMGSHDFSEDELAAWMVMQENE